MSRKAFLAREALRFLLMLIVIMTFVFVLPRLSGKDPLAELVNDPTMDARIKQYYIERWGLQLPLHQQYVNFMVGMFTGDFGYSVTFKKPVMQSIGATLPNTVGMLLVAIIISFFVGVAAGSRTAHRPHRRFDRSLYAVCRVILAMPSFWVAMLIVLVFGSYFPIIYGVSSEPFLGGAGASWSTAILLRILPPALTLALFGFARNVLYARGVASTLPTLQSVFKSAPMLRTLATDFATLTSGSVLVETVYRFPGMGRLMFDAITRADFQLVQGVFFVLAVTVLVISSGVRFIEAESRRRHPAEGGS